ncbi:MAG: dephospho-CoA kinase [Ignavibacteria bacterium]|nr:dephospho-CoA kinase [Ignavibacteria bacterium]
MSNPKKNKLKIAVTGGIGSGKSTFCDYLSNEGFFVLKADDLAKELLNSDNIIKSKVIRAFGVDAYTGNSVNKIFLAEKVFSNPHSVQKINAIIHPRVIEETVKVIDEQLKTNDLVFVEAALIFEAKMEDLFDYIIVITSDLEKRIERIIKRDNVTREEVLKRMENQLSEETKRKKADFVFINNGNQGLLNQNAKFLISILPNLKKKHD